MSDPVRAYLAAVEARAKAATPAPWSVVIDALNLYGKREVHGPSVEIIGFTNSYEQGAPSSERVIADLGLIAHARTDLLRLVQMLRRCVEAMDQARRESASEPKSAYARAATIILNAALADLAALCEGGKG